MIILVVGDSQTFRRSHIDATVVSVPESEIIMYDETYGSVADLERYLYPSLFSPVAPIVHVKFMLASDSDVLSTAFLKKILASPTLFIFEEMTLPTPLITVFKKAGAVVHVGEKLPSVQKEDIFAATLALTAPDKKARWIAYRKALETHSIEAIIGILYWKVRDLATKHPKDAKKYIALYKTMLAAHADAWQKGIPLELMVEKVILTQ